MREVNVQIISEKVAKAFIDANLYLSSDLENRIRDCAETESTQVAKETFSDMLKNLDAAKRLQIPICQDCGMAVIFAEIGQDVHLTGGSFIDAVNRGVAKGYEEGYLRKSVVADPIKRGNTGNNTPAIIHTSIVDGDKIKLTCAPKGFGSENMSRIKMFNPSAAKEEIIDFIVDTVKTADARPCPPVVLGVGIGGDFEYAALLSKKALCRSVEKPNENEFYAVMEREALNAINALGIGAQGYSGDITALAVNIETYPTHIAGLPVAVNVGCHVTRHKTVEI
ncbi:MAG: fumarate hydratase [Oscillospiraceae bacterium]|nr:fumarate hydratase [Oscillospiraceae bacterium]